jgi:hypothetical protein
MNEYPDWVLEVTPHTNEKATVKSTRTVSGVYAIDVVGGKYRGATLNGIFEVVNSTTATLPGRILVRCSWFGVTPPTTYPQLDVKNATVKHVPNYTLTLHKKDSK